jgi:hypothetical protein
MGREHKSPRESIIYSEMGLPGRYYGSNPDNIGNLPDKVVSITSPPYEGALHNVSDSLRRIDQDRYEKGLKYSPKRNQDMDWPESQGQIGQEQGETYLSEMLKVYQQAALCCSVLVLVVKDPTRDGKIRRLGRDTVKLLRRSGFRIIDYHRAILFEELEQPTLFGGIEKKIKGRLSFFKRLSYKRGSPVAAYEHIIFAQNLRDGTMVSISSPPYSNATKNLDDIERWDKEKAGRIKEIQSLSVSMMRPYSDNPANIGNLPDRR